MENNHILLSYPESDSSIRTVCKGSVVYFSLLDVVKTLASQNVKLSENRRSDGLAGLIKAQIEALDADECCELEGESFVTEPGLFRIILRDNSEACKKFQRWVLHEVLPSIRKYGTYPPPLVEQDSDVKRIVQSLLMEIEERENLEKRTKEQFKRHEMMLNDLSKKISQASRGSDSGKFISVIQYCRNNGIDLSHVQIIFGWCLKIVAEKGEPTIKKMIEGKEVLHFPEHVLAKANESRLA